MWLGTALYALFLVTSQFEHHDLICHLKNPQHCTSCVSSQLGSDPQSLTTPAVARLSDAGQTHSLPVTADDALLIVRSPGRSPPQPNHPSQL